MTAAAISALRSWRPDLSPDAAEQLLLSTATQAPGGPRLNVGSAFRAAGLASIVDTAPPVEAPPSSPPPDDGLPNLAPPKKRLPKPRGTVRRQAGHPRQLSVRLRSLPRGAIADIKVADRRIHGRKLRLHQVAHRQTRRRAMRIDITSRRSLRVTVRFVDRSHTRTASRPLVVRVAAPARKKR